MNQNIINLVIVLVAANVLLIAVAILRSFLRRRRERAAGPQRVANQLRSVASLADPLVATTHDVNGQSIPNRTDPLTGLLLPGDWNRIIADEDARNHRYGRPATVVILELDGLERLTGALGPQAADRVVPALADALSRNARGADHLARLGPARFGILLPETTEIEAVNYVERVRLACDLWLESGAIALRLAIGWASPAPGTDLSAAVTSAESRMYAELHRNARRAGELGVDETAIVPDASGSPSPA